jgi:hypothetical protein
MESKIKRIEGIIRAKRQTKLISICISSALAVASLVILFALGGELYAFLPSLLAFILLIVRLFSLLRDRSVRLFGDEFRGTVVKKQEKSEIHDSMITGSYGSYSEPRPYEHGRVRVIVSTVYAKSESGEIVSIGKFNEDQTAYLAVGDEIVIPKYARYPIITNEKESRQKWLCPLCGEVNRDGTPCTGCGFEYD